ncbi:heme-binding protein [Pararhizobium sp. YC-54]|uniref:GlcG/HbpS family heme-binding protein n=1 Tax=Pararhizobium sp. YC-54 TaxID=2986920 RepID=UPI0021F6AE07|nr:heme-binding protein [Pararhizobium sp. YC-54]MCW0001879.1 heme-binding protein [Pararhizobium sp. YC-54]
MNSISLTLANSIIGRCFAHAKEMGFKPLSVAVLDAGGHLVAFQKQDGASMLRFEIAFGKAYGALSVGFGSRWLEKAAIDRPHFVAGLTAVSGGQIIPVPGGVLIRDQDGVLIGAVGVTGDTSDNDEASATSAIISVGFVSQAD